MKKRIFSGLLALIMVLSWVPVIPAEAADEVYYELDTDGIEYGAEYLIVSNSNYALNGAGSPGDGTPVTVVNGNTIYSFPEEAECLWLYETGTNGLKNNGRYLGLATQSAKAPFYQDTPFALSIGNNTYYAPQNQGKYVLYTKAGTGSYIYYLTSSANYATIFASGYYMQSYASGLRFFKKIGGETAEPTYTISFNGNGNTTGTAPAMEEDLKAGDTYTIPDVGEDFSKVLGNHTYLFWCWTENQDGTGKEYRPGETITVERDMELYAQWYLSNEYTVTVVMDLNDVPTDIDKILGKSVKLYIRLEEEGSSFIPLSRAQEGVYTAVVNENGTYLVYAQYGDEEPEAEHGHRVIIYNQDGITELLNYSVSYDANGGAFQNPPETVNYHANTKVTATAQIPVREGYRFLGWKAEPDGQLIAPGQVVTEQLLKETVLTAQWEDLVNVTVDITVNHNGDQHEHQEHQLLFNLLQQINGVDMPVESVEKDQWLGPDSADWGYVYDTAKDVASYQRTFTGLPQGDYIAAVTMSHYDVEITKSVENNGDQQIRITLTYNPGSFDLEFEVIVNHTQETKELLPVAVNVRVLYWNGTKWQIIDSQGQGTPPVSVFIDENGRGYDFFPVGKYWEDGQLYNYRVAVTSFVLPDGTVVPASGNDVTYTPDGTGLYTATVTVENGAVADYPGQASLPGAVYDENAANEQSGMPTVTVEIRPYTVTFDAGDGLLNQQPQVVLKNQYRFPDLRQFVPVPNEYDGVFNGWSKNGKLAENRAGQYLTENITYVANYNPHQKIQGGVYANAVYEQDGQQVEIADADRIKRVMVVLQKNINGVYNDVDSCLVEISYDGREGAGQYAFDHLVADGTEYRIFVLQHNYAVSYDNNADRTFGDGEYAVVFENDLAQVDIQLQLAPDLYDQLYEVNTQQIGEDFRPTGVKMQILYRDLGSTLPYRKIAQQNNDQGGTVLSFDPEGISAGVQGLWKWHNNITRYEYQLNIETLYGDVPGVLTPEGVAYSEHLPFTVQYDMPAYYMDNGEQPVLRATLIPKEYEIIFDMGLNAGEEVEGMDEYHTDTSTGERYSYHHTWSKTAEFDAYPYREGYVFDGWECQNQEVIITKGGHVVIPAALAEEVVLTARWRTLESNAYAVYHLEINTDEVLLENQLFEGIAVGTTVRATAAVQSIKGYEYAGALIGGIYYDKTEEPQLVTNEDPNKNVLVIYYRPDGSDGYTEQVEENIYLNKDAVLEDDGTYTITLETYTKDSPITTQILQNTPLDIVLVLDQSGSMNQGKYVLNSQGQYEYRRPVDALKESVGNFINMIAEHGRKNEVDHRIAVVGYANGETGSQTAGPIAGKDGVDGWINTGVFDSNGDFQAYSFKGFDYVLYEGEVEKDGVYYTKVTNDGKDEFLLMTFHEEYRHLITEDEAEKEILNGTTIYGYVYDQRGVGSFVELTRNTSGLWLYGDRKLYSSDEFFTYHQNVWTHRHGLDRREIHGYGVGSSYTPADGHQGVYTRIVSRSEDAQQSIYKDALMPVAVGANGAGGVNPSLLKVPEKLGANGMTYVGYGMEMANAVLEANPLATGEERQRIVVVFTDGRPGDNSNFDDKEANHAISQAFIATDTHKARIYTVGMYSGDEAAADSDQAYFMNGLSSNYPNAQSLDDVWTSASYKAVTDSGTDLYIGGYYYTPVNGEYCKIQREARNGKHVWLYTNGQGQETVITTVAYGTKLSFTDGVVTVGNETYPLYKKVGVDYTEAASNKYYTVAESQDALKAYFDNIVTEITTKITAEIVLHDDTILRDIMGQGLVLTPDTQIVAYKQKGFYNEEDKTVTWTGINEEVAKIENLNTGETTVYSDEKADISYELPDGTVVTKPETPYISVYNLQSANPTDPNGKNYHPHTVDVTGYDFTQWYIGEGNPNGYGYKMVVKISRVEATDDVVWGRSTTTNNSQSGLWLPRDSTGNKELLLPFDQPTTIFVERAYVLDYGKEFTLSGWYFDDDGQKVATPVHLDCDVANGMNYFDPAAPNTKNTKNSSYGNTKYGNVKIENGEVVYSPTTMNWGGYDQFLVFGDTWRKTVLAQDANENGNLWNKVTVIPANNVYYEDSFVTTESTEQNGISGFTFTGAWTVVTQGEPGQNVEKPEQLEDETYGKVHGWTDALADDHNFTDGSAHVTGQNGEKGASVEFTFTGTGVDVYTRTNVKSGLVLAMLTSHTTDAQGNPVNKLVKSFIMENQAVSGDYYHIPTVSFDNLVYGSYTLKIIASASKDFAAGTERCEYYVDGVRVYNALGSTQNYNQEVVKDAYGKELNAVYTEVRDILLQYEDFNLDLEDDTIGKQGAVFIDQIKEGQESGNDTAGTKTYTYEVGTFREYGPKNEVYLSSGQAIVLKVAEGNNYYVGLKSLTGETVTANISGKDTMAEPTSITLDHTADLYYQVTPIDGYIVIQNGGGGILSITNLKTTNMTAPAENGGVLPVVRQNMLMFMQAYSMRLEEVEADKAAAPQPETEEKVDSQQQVEALFDTVSQWLREEDER